jgi:hypothetical protein
VLLCVSHCHLSIQIRTVLISVTFSCASSMYLTVHGGEKKSFVMYVTAVLVFCYCKQYVMSVPQYDFLKELSVSLESFDSNDYTFLNSLCFPFHLLDVQS